MYEIIQNRAHMNCMPPRKRFRRGQILYQQKDESKKAHISPEPKSRPALFIYLITLVRYPLNSAVVITLELIQIESKWHGFESWMSESGKVNFNRWIERNKHQKTHADENLVLACHYELMTSILPWYDSEENNHWFYKRK